MFSLTTNLPDGTRRVISATVSQLLDVNGQVISQWTPTAAELATLQEQQALEAQEAARQALRDQIAAGIDALHSARDGALADVPVAEGLHDGTLQIKGNVDAAKAANEDRRTTVAGWQPQDTYTAADLVAMRDEIVAGLDERIQLLDLLSTVLQAFADGFTYRAANDNDAATGHDLTAGLAQIVSGAI